MPYKTAEARRAWRKANAEAIALYRKMYREKNKGKISEATREYQKAYREAHREEMRAAQKKYRETHKDDIRSKRSTPEFRQKEREMKARGRREAAVWYAKHNLPKGATEDMVALKQGSLLIARGLTDVQNSIDSVGLPPISEITETLLPTRHAAAYLGMRVTSLHQWSCHGGKCRPVKIGGRLMWAVSDIKAVLAAREAKQGA